MDVPADIQSFWSEFLIETGRPPATPLYDVFFFGDRREAASSLADLVVQGDKVATSCLLWEHEAEGVRLPEPGDLSVVTNWEGEPLCVIETSDVRVRAFDEVDRNFAAAEGEGDRTLAAWKRAHWAFFARRCQELGREPTPEMPVVCQRFRVLYRGR